MGLGCPFFLEHILNGGVFTMSITFHCSECGKRYKVKDGLAGKPAKCGCGHVITVPHLSETEPGPDVAAANVPNMPAPDHVDPSTLSDSVAKPRWYDRNAIVILLLVIFFPVGLYALWKNRHYSKKMKVIVTGCVALLLLISVGLKEATKQTIEEADSLWVSGQQDVAVAKYKQMVSENLNFINEDDRPRVFERIIEYEMAHGNKSTAQHFMEKAVSLNVSLAIVSPEASAMPPQIQAERTPKRSKATYSKLKSSQKVTRNKPRVSEKVKHEPLLQKEKENNRPTNITWQEYVNDCGVQAQKSNEVQAESLFREKYKGKVVKWSGGIMGIESKMLGGSRITIMMSPCESPITGIDITLNVPRNVDVKSLNKNDMITFVGRIRIQGGVFTPHQLDWIGR
ncbi:MAG: hypothetical protein ACYTF1_27065, partial [Planctomycetota bacterium]|jgi:hypothetical protein